VWSKITPHMQDSTVNSECSAACQSSLVSGLYQSDNLPTYTVKISILQQCVAVRITDLSITHTVEQREQYSELAAPTDLPFASQLAPILISYPANGRRLSWPELCV
jgi:hypothetical protein